MARRTDDVVFAECRDRIKRAEARMNTRALEWTTYFNQYRMNLSPLESPPDDSVWVNYYFGLIRNLLPSIYSRNPDVVVSARGATPKEYAQIVEKLLNYQLCKLGLERAMRRVIVDAFFCGIGWIKLGFAPALMRPKRRKLYDTFDVASSLQDLFEGDEGTTEEEVDPEEAQATSSPFIKRVSPRFILTDPLCTGLDDSRFLIHRILKTPNQVKESGRYAKSATKSIQGTFTLQDELYLNSDPLSSSASLEDGDGESLVCVYEQWDRETGELVVIDSYHIREGENEVLRRDKWPYELGEYPFEPLVFNDDPDSLYGIPDAKVWKNPAQAINLINTMGYRHAKRASRKYIVEKGMVDDEEMSKLESPDDLAFAFVNGSPGEVIKPLPDASLSPDVYGVGQTLRSELIFISGVTENRKGLVDREKTATEAQITESHSQIRDGDRSYAVGKMVENIAQKLFALDQEFLDPATVSFLTDPAAMLLWQQLGEAIINAEVLVEVRIGSGSYVSKEIKVQQLMAVADKFGAAVDPLTRAPLVNLREIVRRVVELIVDEDPAGVLMPEGAPPLPPMPQPGSVSGGATQNGGPRSLGEALAAVRGAAGPQVQVGPQTVSGGL